MARVAADVFSTILRPCASGVVPGQAEHMPLDYEKLMRTTVRAHAADATRARTRSCTRWARRRLAGSVSIRNELKYVYEKILVALPTLAVTLAAGAMRLADPRFGINYRMLLHAEQSLELHKPLPVEGTVVSDTKLDEIYDKGAAKGAIMYMTRTLHDESTGDLLVTMGTVSFLRGGWRLRRQERRGAEAARQCPPIGRPTSRRSCRLRSIRRSSIAWPATTTRCTSTRRSRAVPVSIGRSCMGLVPTAWRVERSSRCCAATIRARFQAPRRALHEPGVSGRAAARRTSGRSAPAMRRSEWWRRERKVVVEDFGASSRSCTSGR